MTAYKTHGGCDVPWDFSTNANCLGPCPHALHAVRQVDHSRYPDSRYEALIKGLAAWHGVHISRVLLGASASELIGRIHMALSLLSLNRSSGVCNVAVPKPAYGDYASSALACGHIVLRQDGLQGPEPAQIDLQWHTVPNSPLGQNPSLDQLVALVAQSASLHVVDAAYQTLLLDGQHLPRSLLDSVWSLWSPNKSLGLCGVRGAYAIAPVRSTSKSTLRFEALADLLRQLEPSWALGADGLAMLSAWVSEPVQSWLSQSLEPLRHLKVAQLGMLNALGIRFQPSLSNFFVVQLASDSVLHTQRLQALLARGVALRDTQSMGLPGWARMRVHTEHAQRALQSAWKDIE